MSITSTPPDSNSFFRIAPAAGTNSPPPERFWHNLRHTLKHLQEMTDYKNDIQDDEFRVITHSDYHKHSRRNNKSLTRWIIIALAAAVLLLAVLLIL